MKGQVRAGRRARSWSTSATPAPCSPATVDARIGTSRRASSRAAGRGGPIRPSRRASALPCAAGRQHHRHRQSQGGAGVREWRGRAPTTLGRETGECTACAGPGTASTGRRRISSATGRRPLARPGDTAADLLRRADGRRVRVEPLRGRALPRDALARPGYSGVMAFTLLRRLAGALGVSRDVLVAYPSADARPCAGLPHLPRPPRRSHDGRRPGAARPGGTETPPVRRPVIRVCIDVDASWRGGGRLHVGVRRSPLHSPADAASASGHRDRADSSWLG